MRVRAVVALRPWTTAHRAPDEPGARLPTVPTGPTATRRFLFFGRGEEAATAGAAASATLDESVPAPRRVCARPRRVQCDRKTEIAWVCYVASRLCASARHTQWSGLRRQIRRPRPRGDRTVARGGVPRGRPQCSTTAPTKINELADHAVSSRVAAALCAARRQARRRSTSSQITRVSSQRPRHCRSASKISCSNVAREPSATQASVTADQEVSS
jgi:hypothetical protein